MPFGWRAWNQNYLDRQAKRNADLRELAERAARLEDAAVRFKEAGDAKRAANFAEQAAELRRAGA